MCASMCACVVSSGIISYRDIRGYPYLVQVNAAVTRYMEAVGQSGRCCTFFINAKDLSTDTVGTL